MNKKVLLVNWSWYPTGGDWTYVENLALLYQNNGYEVIPFSTINEKNFYTPFKENFISTNDYKQLNKKKSIKNGFKAIQNAIISKEALLKLDKILQEHTFEIAHLHNIHHYLTPAIIWKLKKKNVKVLWTLHDYKIICPENSFVSNGTICEKCITGNFYHCTVNKCKKNSFSASALASAEAYFYHSTSVYKKVDAYLCPSKFLYSKFVQFGFNPSKLFITNYCYNINNISSFVSLSEKRERYILYVGRIEYIKGIKTLIDAVAETGILLKIAGTGTAFTELSEYIKSHSINNVELLGYQDKQVIYDLTSHCQFVVCPSEWYENFPFSIIESLLFSKPVIGSRIGGIPELVLDGQTGFLFEPGNIEELREKIIKLWNNKSLTDTLASKALVHVKNLVDFENHWNKLNPIINNLS